MQINNTKCEEGSHLGSESRHLMFENPATELDIVEIEKKLTYQLPNDFRNILLTVSSYCEFKWFCLTTFGGAYTTTNFLW